MNDKQKKLINFLIVDTGYWILTILAFLIILTGVVSFIGWDSKPLILIWSVKWFLLRVTLFVSLLFAIIGGWSNGRFN